MILPPAPCTASTTRFQPASASSPWKRGTSGCSVATAWSIRRAFRDDEPDAVARATLVYRATSSVGTPPGDIVRVIGAMTNRFGELERLATKRGEEGLAAHRDER